MRISDWSSDVCSSDLRVILDTNILLSGLISPGGVPAQLIEAWLDRKFILVSHALQLDELREVSRREKIRSLIRPSEAGRLINKISAVDRKSVVSGKSVSVRVDLSVRRIIKTKNNIR